MQVGRIIREARQRFGLTQTELAFKSGLSLPSIQNIEAGKANPSYSTIESLFKVLGLRLSFDAEPMDWDRLIILGAPLSPKAELPRLIPSSVDLIRELKTACYELARNSQGLHQEKRAVQALLIALKFEYPSFFEKHFATQPAVQSLLLNVSLAEFITLVRFATSQLAKYL